MHLKFQPSLSIAALMADCQAGIQACDPLLKESSLHFRITPKGTRMLVNTNAIVHTFHSQQFIGEKFTAGTAS
jgi:hypothetical protein